jgi:hypothetical protein
MVDCAHLLDWIPQSAQFGEDRFDIGYQVLVHDQFATVGLAIEAEVIDVDPPQLLRRDGATRPPTRAELVRGDRVNGLWGKWWRRWRCARRRRRRRTGGGWWWRSRGGRRLCGGALHKRASHNGHSRHCAEPLECAERRVDIA